MISSRSWLSLGLGCLITGKASGDSWFPPREFESPSGNGKFVVRVFPKNGTTNAHAIVYSVRKDGRSEAWRTELSNPVSPGRAFVADDGTALVTLDNWGRVGYGDNVVGIYGARGLLAKYSLEQFAPPPPPKPKNEAEREITILDDDGYHGKFSHSTSSRHWRQYGRERFVRDDGRLLFCIWLDWDQRWVTWDMADGALMNVTQRQTERFNLLERDKALEEVKSGKALAGAYNFLGRTKFKEDRPLIEEWLKDSTFGAGSTQKSSSDESKVSFTYTSRSYRREDADRILARWDGLIRDERPGLHENYFFLGTVQGEVHLAREPHKDGSLLIYLIPAETPLDKWAEQKAHQYLTADLAHGPYRFENGKHVNLDVGDTVSFMIYGVTPGRYRLKAVWDKAAPMCESKEVLCLPGTGDYVSVSSPVFEAKKGAVTEGIRLECTQIVR